MNMTCTTPSINVMTCVDAMPAVAPGAMLSRPFTDLYYPRWPACRESMPSPTKPDRFRTEGLPEPACFRGLFAVDGRFRLVRAAKAWHPAPGVRSAVLGPHQGPATSTLISC